MDGVGHGGGVDDLVQVLFDDPLVDPARRPGPLGVAHHRPWPRVEPAIRGRPALQNYGITNVDVATVWGQGHTMAERTGDATTNFITWVKESITK